MAKREPSCLTVPRHTRFATNDADVSYRRDVREKSGQPRSDKAAFCSSRNCSQSRVSARSNPDEPSVPMVINRSPMATSCSPNVSGPRRAEVERSISAGSRPILAHHSSRMRFFLASVSMSPNPCQMLAYSAASRRVFRSPPPPTKIGIGRVGGGFSRLQRERIRGNDSPSAAIRVPGVPNS